MNIKKLFQEYWLYFIVVTQPILDIIAYFTFNPKVTVISFAIRSLYLAFIIIYTFIKSKNIKTVFFLYLIIGIYFLLHVGNTIRLHGLNIFDDVRYFIIVWQMPIIAIALCDYLQDKRNIVFKSKNSIVVAISIIIGSVVLSLLTNSYSMTYSDGYGITGWFNSANTQSMIITILSPWILTYVSKKKNSYYFIACALVFVLLFINGTRACYYSLIFDFILLLYFIIFNRDKKFQKTKLGITLLFLGLSICLYPYSYTYQRLADVNKNAKKIEDKYTVDWTNLTKDQKLYILNDTSIYKKMINTFTEEEVYEVMKDDITPYNMADIRLYKRKHAEILYNRNDTLTKIVGFDFHDINVLEENLENDFTAIFYYYGYLGFALYMAFVLYFVIKAFILMFRRPYLLIDTEFIGLSFVLALSIFAGEYSGALFRMTNANIYIALYLAIYYYIFKKNTRYLPIKKNSITFFVLHLGYGGIETTTINTANALCDKYDVKIISFYNLSKNQSNLLNEKVKVDYLYYGGPNKDKIIELKNKHRYISMLFEGIIAVDILIKKKLLIIKKIIECDSKNIISTRYTFNALLSKYGNPEANLIAQEHHYHNSDEKYINVLKNEYGNIDYLCALTSTLEKDYNQFLKGNNDFTKVVLLPNMLTYYPKKQSNLNFKNIITVSRLDPGKRVDEIIKAFHQVKEKDWNLYIIGDGQEYDNLSNLIIDLAEENRIYLEGYKNKEEIEKYMLDSSIFLMASVSEGLPMVLLEANSYGIPCIAYDIENGINDIIDDSINGFVIKNRDEKEYIKAIEKLINDSDLRRKFGKSALEKSHKFSKEEILDKWNNILK